MPTNTTKILIVLGLTAFCSICYELLIGQAIALTFGGTLSAYTLTIGIFLFSMGVGSLVANRVTVGFFEIELLITILGLAAPVLILSFASIPEMTAFQLFASKLVSFGALSVLGVLTGLEIPIAFKYLSGNQDRTRAIAIDYLGSFAAGLVFAFVMFPDFGLPLSILVVSVLNMAVPLLIVFLGIEKVSIVKKAAGLILAVIVVALTLSHGLVAKTLSNFLVSAK